MTSDCIHRDEKIKAVVRDTNRCPDILLGVLTHALTNHRNCQENLGKCTEKTCRRDAFLSRVRKAKYFEKRHYRNIARGSPRHILLDQHS